MEAAAGYRIGLKGGFTAFGYCMCYCMRNSVDACWLIVAFLPYWSLLARELDLGRTVELPAFVWGTTASGDSAFLPFICLFAISIANLFCFASFLAGLIFESKVVCDMCYVVSKLGAKLPFNYGY